MLRRWRRDAWSILGALAPCACASGAAVSRAPVEARPDIVRRHWDQACSTGDRTSTFVRVAELFDTVGLGRELAELRLVPRPLAPPWPMVDFVTRYGVDGRPTRMGVWEPTVDPGISERVETILSTRARPLPSLLEPTGFRTRVVFATRPRFEVAAPVVCLPHVVHERGRRATGLPDTVGTWGGRTTVREGDDSTAVVRIVVDPGGTVRSVVPIQGTTRAVEAARGVIAGLRFEPALSNGEPVQGELLQTFRFRRGPAH